MAQRPALTRLDVIVIIGLIVVGVCIWPVAAGLVTLSRSREAPLELDYQARQGVFPARVELKGHEDQLAKAREKLAEALWAATPDPNLAQKLQPEIVRLEAAVASRAAALARAESSAARAYAHDLKWYEWKGLGRTAAASVGAVLALLLLAATVGAGALKLARLPATWRKIVPIAGALVLLSFGYQAGQVTGLIALAILIAIVVVGQLLVAAVQSGGGPHPDPGHRALQDR